MQLICIDKCDKIIEFRKNIKNLGYYLFYISYFKNIVINPNSIFLFMLKSQS